MTPRIAIYLSLLTAVLHGVVTELYMRRGVLMPAGVTTAFTLVFCVLAYIWYHQDAQRRRFPRRPALSAAIILLPFIGLPVYAALSRAPAGRVRSALRMLGFIGLLLLTSVGCGIALSIAKAP